MFKIKINSLISIIISKAVLIISKHFFKGGSNFPGRIALKFDKKILKTVAKGYSVILITGTNGKTTTTSMIYNIINKSGKFVITNSTGANMLPGIVATFIDNYKFTNSNKEKYAVIEVDEANVKFITKYIDPKIITITNLFRDQLDRYGEVYTTLNKILEGINLTESSLLVLNGDESLLGDLKVKNTVKYYGFNLTSEDSAVIEMNADAKFCINCKEPYQYNYISYNHLGDFYCPNCGYKRPELDYHVDELKELTPYNSSVEMNGTNFTISQPGIYNIYNALCAYSIGRELAVSEEVIKDSLKNQSSHFGRQETLQIDSKEVKIILVKNPAGYNQSIDTVSLDKRNFSTVFLLNDNYADGRDISWICDVNFEKMCNLNIDNIIIGGDRLYDMSIRLKIGGFDQSKFKLAEDFETVVNYIKTSESNYVYILATYTAMINFRKYLHNKGYIDKLW